MSDAVTFTPTGSTASAFAGIMQSAAIGELLRALYQALPNIRGAAKDRENPHLHSRYADLGSVYDACKAPLYAAEILILQQIEDATPPAVVVVTTLHHAPSGQWISSRLRLHAKAADPQAIGSAITYARRYTLATIAGVVGEDDDGNAASRGEVVYTGRESRVTVYPAGTSPVAKLAAKPAAASQHDPATAAAIAASERAASAKPAADPTMATRKAAAVARLERNLGKEKAAETLAAIVKQNTTNAARLKALEDAAALYKESTP